LAADISDSECKVLENVDVNVMLIALVGVLIVLAPVVSSLCSRLGVPALVGYLVLGFALRLIDEEVGLLQPAVRDALSLLGNIGLVALLFAVGIESNPVALAAKLPTAARIWLADITVSGGLAFAVTYFALGLSMVASLICAAALTATSVGVSVGLWRESDALNTTEGQLLVNVAELDDVSAMALMAIVFAVVPVMMSGGVPALGLIGTEFAWFLLRFTLFLAFCLVFARYFEHRVTGFSRRLTRPPERMLVVAGVGFIIASFSGALGFSLAIGAFFAGLVFSRDPEAVKTESSFQDVYAFVTPFFFIDIGMRMDPGALGGAIGIGLVLLLVALVGKLVGNFLAALLTTGASGAMLIALSMIPRAEVAMVVFDQGRTVAPEHVTNELYSAAILTSAITCVVAPLIVGRLLRTRAPQLAAK
jgi:Kef-type K+ transport system membrane component KefB